MGNMEHTIEQVAQRLHSSYCECEGWYAECQGPQVGDRRVARRLAAEGLIAPAPLREEWGSEVRDVRPDRDPYVLWAIDLDNAQWQIEHNPEWATGRIMHRYRTDWLPVDRAEDDGRADRPSWVDEHGINHADGDGGRW